MKVLGKSPTRRVKKLSPFHRYRNISRYSLLLQYSTRQEKEQETELKWIHLYLGGGGGILTYLSFLSLTTTMDDRWCIGEIISSSDGTIHMVVQDQKLGTNTMTVYQCTSGTDDTPLDGLELQLRYNQNSNWFSIGYSYNNYFWYCRSPW